MVMMSLENLELCILKSMYYLTFFLEYFFIILFLTFNVSIYVYIYIYIFFFFLHVKKLSVECNLINPIRL